MTAIIYGPVRSWRLGRSLGVNLLGDGPRMCSYDCVYCELGPAEHHVVRRKEFVTLDQVRTAMNDVAARDFDYVTFSGAGEPTLAVNLGAAIDLARAVFNKPIAVLTNAGILTREDVRLELAKADVASIKLDAPDDVLFRRINRPWVRTTIGQIIDAVKLFRSSYHGKLALQIMFTTANKDAAPEMARIAQDIAADEVCLNTPLRPCAVSPLSPDDMAAIKTVFLDVNGLRMVYDELNSLADATARRPA